MLTSFLLRYQNTQAAAGADSSYTLNTYLHQAPSTNERLTIDDEIQTPDQARLFDLDVETDEYVAIVESVKSSKKPKTKSGESKKKSQDKKKERKSEKL